MGYLSNAKCHATVADAVQANCAAYPIATVAQSASGVQSLRMECQAFTGTGFTVQPYVDGVAGTAITLTPTYASCDENAERTDLMQLWGLGLAALVVVYLAKQFFVRQILANH